MRNCPPTNTLINEANLLCWMLAGELHYTLQAENPDTHIVRGLTDMLKSVSQLLIGREHPVLLVASELKEALRRIEVNRVKLEIGDAVERFAEAAQETAYNYHSLSQRQCERKRKGVFK